MILPSVVLLPFACPNLSTSSKIPVATMSTINEHQQLVRTMFAAKVAEETKYNRSEETKYNSIKNIIQKILSKNIFSEISLKNVIPKISSKNIISKISSKNIKLLCASVPNFNFITKAKEQNCRTHVDHSGVPTGVPRTKPSSNIQHHESKRRAHANCK